VQAIGQCRPWLAKHLAHAEMQEVSSTSLAARMASQDSSLAAISNFTASEVYSIPVLAANIHASSTNTTRFFVLFPSTTPLVPLDPPQRYKSAIMFVVSHREPGALCDALAAFKTHSIDLTSIQSRPFVKAEPKLWQYVFFLEFTRHQDDPAVKAALNELQRHCLELKVLGTFPDKNL